MGRRKNGQDVMKWVDELKMKYEGCRWEEPFPDLGIHHDPCTCGFGTKDSCAKHVPPKFKVKNEIQ